MSFLEHFTSKCFAFFLAYLLVSTQLNAFQTSSTNAIIVDVNTGIILFEKNADEPIPPASMSKLMTLYMVFEALEKGQLKLDERLRVSQYAMNTYGGSTMFLDTTDTPTVEELIRGVVVLSGNDASVVLAETLSPDSSESGFAQLMNTRSLDMGMTNSNFINSNGWPDPNHYMSVRDLAYIAERIITDYPDYYQYFSEREFSFDGRAPSNRFNRNPLLAAENSRADGLKTGYTQDSGYGLVGSAEFEGNRVLFVLSGLKSTAERADEGLALLNWYNRQFKKEVVFNADVPITKAPIWMGSEQMVDIGLKSPVAVIYPINADKQIKATAQFSEYPQAPIKKGQEIGQLSVEIPALNSQFTTPLIALQDIEKANVIQRFTSTIRILFSNLIQSFQS